MVNHHCDWKVPDPCSMPSMINNRSSVWGQLIDWPMYWNDSIRTSNGSEQGKREWTTLLQRWSYKTTTTETLSNLMPLLNYRSDRIKKVERPVSGQLFPWPSRMIGIGLTGPIGRPTEWLIHHRLHIVDWTTMMTMIKEEDEEEVRSQPKNLWLVLTNPRFALPKMTKGKGVSFEQTEKSCFLLYVECPGNTLFPIKMMIPGPNNLTVLPGQARNGCFSSSLN